MWDFSIVFNAIKMLCIFVFVLVMMIITLRGLAKYQNKLSGNKNIKILERASLSQNTTLNIVKIGGNLFLMSSSSNGISILKELSKDEIDENTYSIANIGDIGFDSIIKLGKNMLKGLKER